LAALCFCCTFISTSNSESSWLGIARLFHESDVQSGPKIFAISIISRTNRNLLSIHWHLFRHTLLNLQYVRTISQSIVRTLWKALESGSLSKLFSQQRSPPFPIWSSSFLVLSSSIRIRRRLRVSNQGNMMAGVIWWTPPLHFSEVTVKHYEVWHYQYAVSHLEHAFSSKAHLPFQRNLEELLK
jgi:hypothetical protein